MAENWPGFAKSLPRPGSSAGRRYCRRVGSRHRDRKALARWGIVRAGLRLKVVWRRGAADAVGAHVFGVSHPSLGPGVAEHVRKRRHPLLVLVTGKLSQGRNAKVDVALVVHPPQVVL